MAAPAHDILALPGNLRSARGAGGALALLLLGLAACSGGVDDPAGAGGAGGAGGTGGGEPFCVRNGTGFRLVQEGLCVDGTYDFSSLTSSKQPTWGRHGGLLSVSRPNAYNPRLHRFTAGTMELAVVEENLDLYPPMYEFSVPGAAGPEAADVPGAEATVFGWWEDGISSSDPAGYLLVMSPQAEPLGYRAFPDGVGAIEADGAVWVVYTGGADLAGVTSPGLHVTEAVAAGQGVELLGGGLVHGFPEGRGVIAVDTAYNVIARMGAEIRGLAAAEVRPGGGPGVAMAQVAPDAEVTLAARAPSGGAPGTLVYQAQPGEIGEDIDIVAIDYEPAGAGLSVVGEPRVIGAGDARLFAAFDPAGDLWLVNWQLPRAYRIELP